ncbi:MAG: hypothetical protein K5929_11200 [Lachnospiraceae bacterium]|nr:hypothetical protein [Lachnospiraceae bacterium]
MAFWFFGKKRKKKEKDFEEHIERIEANVPVVRDRGILGACEELTELAEQYSDLKREYSDVTAYITDCETLTNLPDNEFAYIRETAERLVNHMSVRDRYINRTKKISDSQMILFDKYEDELLPALKKLEENEKYQDTVKRDMSYLEGEKLQWIMHRDNMQDEKRILKNAAMIVFGIFSFIMIVLIVMYLGFEADITYGWLITAILAIIAGFVILVRYQNDDAEIRIATKNAKRAIELLNKVKIKYVNITNAVDYERRAYNVKDYRDFSAQLEDYQEACRERTKYLETNQELDFYNEKLVKQLSKYKLYDSRAWLEIPYILVNPGDMVERKHQLYLKRQKLREDISNIDAEMAKKRYKLKQALNTNPEYTKEIKDILYMTDRITGE